MKYLRFVIPILIVGCSSIFSVSKTDNLEQTAKESFELFRSNEHQELVDRLFCDNTTFWKYTWKSLGSQDSLDTPEMRDGMKELRLEFKEKFAKSLAYCYNEGEQKYKIDWSTIDDYSIKVYERTLQIKEYSYELLIPTIAFHHNGQHLMWGYETLVRNEQGTIQICAKRVDLGPFKEME